MDVAVAILKATTISTASAMERMRHRRRKPYMPGID